jgi:hypothetical protein
MVQKMPLRVNVENAKKYRARFSISSFSRSHATRGVMPSPSSLRGRGHWGSSTTARQTIIANTAPWSEKLEERWHKWVNFEYSQKILDKGSTFAQHAVADRGALGRIPYFQLL